MNTSSNTPSVITGGMVEKCFNITRELILSVASSKAKPGEKVLKITGELIIDIVAYKILLHMFDVLTSTYTDEKIVARKIEDKSLKELKQDLRVCVGKPIEIPEDSLKETLVQWVGDELDYFGAPANKAIELVDALIDKLKEKSAELSNSSQLDSLCYIYAEMDDRVIIHCVTPLKITVSGDKIEFQSNLTAQGGTVSVKSDKRLIIQVITKTNFTIIGDDRVEIDPPAPGQRHQLDFNLRPTNLGEGEVWIDISQGQMSLLTLSLKPQIVESWAQIRISPSSKAHTNGSITDFPSPSEPLHQLRIIEQRNDDRVTYQYELNSPKLELLDIFKSAPITSKRQEYVENLYKEIESRWLSNQDDVEAFTAELRAFGGQLFDKLFPKELQSLLWQYHSKIKSIMVLSTEPFIPWELVHLKQPGQRLPKETRFLGQMGLVRWLYGTFPPQTIQIRKEQVFYVIPQYPDKSYRLPQAEQEAQFLEQIFHAKAIEPQSSPVRQLLESGNLDLLHFAGHGMAEQDNIGNAKLLMQGRIEDSKYILDYLSATTIEQYSNLKSEIDKNRPMVVLNACQIGREGYTLTSIGGFAQAFLRGGAGAFVGSLWSVGDRPARIFIETFYKGLIKGLTLSEATIRAREQAKQAGDATWLAYAVYGHPNLKVNCSDPDPQ